MRLEVQDLGFSYGERSVLRGISLQAGAGELIALLGPNGAGKSTLMRCLLGLAKNYTGEIRMDGENIGSLRRGALAKKIAYVPQTAPVVFNYTVLESVLMGTTGSMGVFESPGPEQENKARNILEQLGIAHLEKRGCEALSGGERQLVLLARALLQDAPMLIMDEPTANLDYGNQSRVMEQVSRLSAQGYTVLFSTHDPNQALLYASRALTLWEGKLLTDGAPKETLTEDILGKLYGIPVQRYTLGRDQTEREVCVPGRTTKEEL